MADSQRSLPISTGEIRSAVQSSTTPKPHTIKRVNSLRSGLLSNANVDRRISDELDLPALELFAYFNFRIQSEQDALNEPAWA
jgi:hypothetical protein